MSLGTEWKSPDGGTYSVRQSSLHPVRYGIWAVRNGTGRWALAKPAHMSSENKMQAVLDRSCCDCCEELRHTGAMVVAFATTIKKERQAMIDAELMANEVVSLLQKSSRVDGEVRFFFDVHEGIPVAVFRKLADCYYDYSMTVPTSAMDIAPEDAAWTGAVVAIYDKAIRSWAELAAWEKI